MPQRPRKLRGAAQSAPKGQIQASGADPLAGLHERIDDLSRGHRVVARYVLSHMDETAFLTATNLAKRCGTSEATTIRFAQALGFRGFPEFQAHLRALVRQKLGPGDKVRRTSPIPSKIDTLFDEVTEKAIENIRQTRRMQSGSVIEAAARALLNARVLYVVGLRGSSGTARTFAFFLSQLRSDVRLLTDGGPVLLEALVSVSDKDAMLAISFPRYTRGTIDALYFVRGRGARTVVVTDSSLSPAAMASEFPLVAQADAFFSNSYAPAIVLLDVLAACVFRLGPEAAHAHLDAVEEMFRGHDFFFSSSVLPRPATPARKAVRSADRPPSRPR